MPGPADSVVPALKALLSRGRREPDGDLLGRFLQGRDEDAFGELVRRHGPMVYGVCRRVVRDRHDAEDVFQATFLLLARKAASIRQGGGLASWLHRTAYRLALRSRRRAGGVSPLWGGPQQGPDVRRSPDTVLDALTAGELLGLIDDELSHLPENQRSAVLLCALEGRPLDEAAGLLGCSVGAVKGRLERGRARLRQRLERRGVSLPGAMAVAMLTDPPPAALVEAVVAGRASASALSLAGGGIPVGLARLAAVAVLLCGVLAAASALRDKPKEPEAPAATGERLPEGARLRLGGMERRAFMAKFVVSADGKTVVVVRGFPMTVAEYDARTGRLLASRTIPTGRLGGRWELSPDGRWLVTYNPRPGPPGGPSLAVWDVGTGKLAGVVSAEGCNTLNPGSFSADGKRVCAYGYVTSEKKTRVLVWDWASGVKLFTAEVDGEPWFSQVELTGDGGHVVAVSSLPDAGVRCWEVSGGKLLWRDTSPSVGVLITPGGKVISDLVVRLVEHDLLTGRRTSSLRLPRLGRGHHMALTKGGGQLVESGPKGGHVWDLRTGENVGKFPGDGSAVAATPDGRSVVTIDGTLQRYDLKTGEPAYPDERARGHLDEVIGLVFSADGKRLASASLDGSVGVWDVASDRPVHLQRRHRARRLVPHYMGWTGGGVRAFDMDPGGRVITSADNLDACRVFDLKAGKETPSFRLSGQPGRPDADEVRHVRLDPDGRSLTGLVAPDVRHVPGAKATVRLVRWEIADGKASPLGEVADRWPTLFPPTPKPDVSAIDGAGRFFVLGGQVHDGRTARPLAELSGWKSRSSAYLSADGSLVAGAEEDNRRSNVLVRIAETHSGKEVALLPAGGDWSEEMGFHPGGRHLAVSGKDSVRLVDMRSGQVVKRWPVPEGLADFVGTRVKSLAFSPDGKTLATGHPDGTILLWDADLPAVRPEPAKPGEIDDLWRDLGGDARRAYRAAWRLADLPREAVPFLRGRLKPAAPAPAATTAVLLRDLDADGRPTRDKASATLRALGRTAEPALRAALARPASAEQKRRIGQLLAALDALSLTAEEIRALRAAAILGWVGTPDGLAALRRLAGGAATDPLTRQANASLVRRAATVSR